MSHRRLGTAMTGRRTPYRVKLKTDLNAAFEAISLTGKFAGWEALPRAPPAWLYVDGVGDISMPLGEEQIMQIIGKAQQTPYGSTTPEEPDVGGPVGNNIWELNPDQLEFLDPEWPNYLLMLRDLVESKLDVDGPIRLNFHRMMIFGKGAMSTPQTDIQRTRGMFGTLMICLPSAHEGGEVRVEHNGESMVLGGSDASQSFSCWYSDVTHEILPVKSGYRCVLTYNLATRPDLTPPTASALDLKKLPLRNTLESWIKDLASKKTSKVPSHLYQVLDHEYFEPPTCMKEFNDKDLARVHLLEGFQPELPFEILLASLEKNEQGPITREYQRKRLESDNSGSDRSDSEQYDSDWDSMAEYHELDEVEDVEYCVKSLRTLDGTIIASSCDLNLNFCLAADPFENLNEPSEECFDDFACHVFRTSALVIVPHQKIGEYLAHCAHESEIPRSTSQDETLFGECQSALRFLGHICSDLPLQISMLDAMCILFVSASKTTFRKLDAAVILQIALQYSHYTLFQTVGLDHKGRLTISFFEWAKELLSSCPDADRAEKYQTWIPFLILSFPSMDDRIRIIEAISNPSDDAAGHEVTHPPLKAESDLWRSSGLKLESATPSSEKIRNITKMSDHSLPTSIGYFRGPGPTGPDVVLPKSSTWTQDMIRRSVVRFPETSNRPTVTDPR
ncbi:hypothetical protein PtA15_1A180 [Puccinia triticina]|uniref:Prolyl 4-hydroxylase alpha subunit Fe(2+) 2OG dioxygenase domain-containing protein n=1 Tax=Puccinia triticina TaxID=208348 RepID=A0ABY7C8R4_9BASI|nr:uncharacterized protein PtA15_1A180 [Puccinia triticina]WAQ80842.1 hypothetical protein PtA15_1A180 [Puccinia triticina]